MEIPRLIYGGTFEDHRGVLEFVNDFNMDSVVRFYVIMNANTSLKRGWTGHKIEQRWFYVSVGEYKISVAKIDDLERLEKVQSQDFILSEDHSQVLHVPPGYATLIQAHVNNSKLMVFADNSISMASKDQYNFPVTNE